MQHINKIFAIALLAFCLAACHKDSPAPDGSSQTGGSEPAIADTLRGVALILNEGSWSNNNASLSLLLNDTTGEVINNWFAQKNGRGLGDVAQDMVAYGSKIYITVWNSNSLEVIDRNTSRSRRIDLGDLSPRYIATHGGKLYISCYNPNCVIRIDTASLKLEASCAVGDYNPEGVAVAGGKLFVASNKAGLPDGSYAYDNKVYAIDLASFANPTPVIVGTNPNKVLVFNDQYVVVNCFGDYNASTYSYSNPKVAAINVSSLEATLYDENLEEMAVYNNRVIGFSTSNGETMYRTLSGSPSAFTVSTSYMDNGVEPYKININPANGDEYLTTTGGYIANGDVRFTAADRSRSWSTQAGMLPSKVIFL